MGISHGSAYTDFNAIPDAGSYYLKGTTNGPNVNSATQYYGMTLGLGSEYGPVKNQTGKYGSQIYWGRNVTNPYINIRYLENGSWGSWRKVAAGYADSAATATTATNQSGGTVNATTGTFSGQVYSSTAFYTDGNRSVIRGGSPTLYFRDTNGYSGMIHNNSNLLYVLRGATDSETWSAINSRWPWIFNLSNNDSTCGRNLYCYGNVTAYSDIRHKKDILKLDNSLEKVCKLNGYTYTRIDDDNRCTGVIAQEVLEVLPEAVNTDEKGEYAVAYGNMAGLFIEAFKELNSKLESAMARIKELENTPK